MERAPARSRASPMDLAFLNPWMLFGLLGIGVPLYVHLRQRQKARRLPFSTLRFVRASDRHTARRHKIVDRIALLIRCLVIGLLALGLSRPLIRPQGADAMGKVVGNTFWAVILDDSYSMGVRDASGRAPFDEARQAVERLIDLMEDGDEVSLLLTSGRTLPGLADATQQIFQVESALETLRPSSGASSVADGVERALTLMRDSTRGTHEMVIVSDLQRGNFEQVQNIDPARLTEKISSFHLLDVGHAGASNQTVRSLKAWRAGPYPGMPITLRAGIGHSGAEGGERVCALDINGERIGERTLTFEGTGEVDVSFQHVLMDPGEYIATVQVLGDSLEADNQRRVALDVYDQVGILLVADPPDSSNPWDAAFFLELAISPQERRSLLAKPAMRIVRKTPQEVAALDLRNFNAVMCADIRSMTPNALRSLQAYVRDGGKLIVFAGEWAATGESGFYADSELFGWKFEGLQTVDAVMEEPRTLSQPDTGHPIFRSLADEPSIDFRTVQVYQYALVKPESLDINSQIVASLDDDAPFMLEKRLGQGAVLCFTAPPSPTWTNLPTRPIFLPLTHELVKYCLRGPVADAIETLVGQPFKLPLPKVSGQTPSRAILLDPDGIRTPLPMTRDATSLEVAGLDLPGVYQIELIYGATQAERVRALVNVDPVEGDLARASEEQLEEWLPRRDRWFVHDSDRAMVTALERKREGLPLAIWLLAAALALFIIESYLVNLLLPRREAAQEEAAAAAGAVERLAREMHRDSGREKRSAA